MIKCRSHFVMELQELSAKTPVDTRITASSGKRQDIFGPYITYPNRPSTAPDYLWTNILGLPTIKVRWCDATSTIITHQMDI